MKYDDLSSMPLDRWQCSDGCAHLIKKSDSGYHCAFWSSFAQPIAGYRHGSTVSPDLTDRRVNGPHTDKPTRLCAQFVEYAE